MEQRGLTPLLHRATRRGGRLGAALGDRLDALGDPEDVRQLDDRAQDRCPVAVVGQVADERAVDLKRRAVVRTTVIVPWKKCSEAASRMTRCAR
jgi:hypothetical protein